MSDAHGVRVAAGPGISQPAAAGDVHGGFWDAVHAGGDLHLQSRSTSRTRRSACRTLGLSNLFAIYLVGLAVTPFGGYLMTRIGMRRGHAVAIALCMAGAAITLSHSLWVVILPGLGLVCTGVFIAQSTAASFLRMAAPAGGRVSAAGLYLSLLLHRRHGGRGGSEIGCGAGRLAGVRGAGGGRAGGDAGPFALAGWKNKDWSTH